MSTNHTTPAKATTVRRTEIPRITTTARLKEVFEAADPFARKDPAPRMPSIKFHPEVVTGPKADPSPKDEYSQIPFPNQNYKPRKTILKNKTMSNCPSLYACYDKSDFTDLVTDHNTMANSGDVKLRRMQKALAVRIMRNRSLGISDDPAKPTKLPAIMFNHLPPIFNPDFPSMGEEKKPAAPAAPRVQFTGAGHFPDVVLVEHPGKLEDPVQIEERRNELKMQLEKEDLPETTTLAPLIYRPKPKLRPPAVTNPFPNYVPPKKPVENPTPLLTVAMIANSKNGTMRFTARKGTGLLPCIHEPSNTDFKETSPEQNAFGNYPKIDFDHRDYKELTQYAMKYLHEMALQELQYRIPAQLHEDKMKDLGRRADEELRKYTRKIDPPVKVKRTRKLGESVTDPFGIQKYKKSLRENAKSGKGVLNVEMPPVFATIHGPTPRREKYKPPELTVRKVSHWLRKSVPTKDTTPLLWVQPVLLENEKDITDRFAVRKFFTVLDGRVVYPFYDPDASNTFAKRFTADTNPYDINSKPEPEDVFKKSVPLGGFQNNEIEFEFLKNVIYISARTLMKYATERCKRRYQGSIQIPEDFTIADFLYSRDQHGTLFIEELSEDEKLLLGDENHLYAHSSRSIHKIYI